MKAKLLITGATGFLGRNLWQVSQQSWDTWGISQHSARAEDAPKLQNRDLTNYKKVKATINDIRPDAIIHLAAHSNPNDCEDNPHSDNLNIHAATTLAGLASDRHIPYVFASTDLVFSGTNAPYDEQATPNPISRYGEQKVLAEQGIHARYDLATICRLPLMFGWAPTGVKCLLRSMYESLQTQRQFPLFTDEFRTPVDALDASKGLLLGIEQPGELLHLGGTMRISRFEMGHLLALELGIENPCIQPKRQDEVAMKARRPADVCLNSEKAFKLGYSPEPPSVILLNFVKKHHNYHKSQH